MEKASKKEKSEVWNITVEDNVPINDIVREMKKLGLKKVNIMEEMGIISGTATAKEVKQLIKVKGVIDVEKDLEVGTAE
ncbi:MAG: hypothetical protein IPL46_01835 [Saprospiraceae bacterium]|nr:hypothetical protein [Saprospiraceae bacterium]